MLAEAWVVPLCKFSGVSGGGKLSPFPPLATPLRYQIKTRSVAIEAAREVVNERGLPREQRSLVCALELQLRQQWAAAVFETLIALAAAACVVRRACGTGPVRVRTRRRTRGE